jgi:5-methylcytosine-specific restriction protein B
MNTADRSVEALDTALRRRFSFEEMAPQPELIQQVGALADEDGVVEDINLVELLHTINQRIEKLIDKHHMIGHSYFLNVASLDDLKSVFQNNILPLLQEYFFGDYGKIGLVLGQDFFEDVPTSKNIFAKFNDYDSGGLEDRAVYRLKNVEAMDNDEFVVACETLLNTSN